LLPDPSGVHDDQSVDDEELSGPEPPRETRYAPPGATPDTARRTERVTANTMIPMMRSVPSTIPTGNSHNESMAASVGPAANGRKGPGR
jgi:hypothetical protein